MKRNACTVLSACSLALIAGLAGPFGSLADALYTVPATSNPWLAGQSEGASVVAYFGGNAYVDVAPTTSPKLATSPALAPGGVLNFLATGAATNGPNHPMCGPDGHATSRPDFFGFPSYAVSNVRAPLNSLVGVFLDESTPSMGGSVPDGLDFSAPGALDFASLSPELCQVFFIGDGLRADGSTPQNFIVPEGATRLYLGVMDGYEWSNNAGAFSVSVRAVPAPGAAAALGLAGLGVSARRRRR